MTLIDPEAKRNFETRFIELMLGLLAAGYGWHALHMPRSGQITSQFQVLLMIEGGAFYIGVGLCFFGILSALAAYSRFRRARFVAHVGLALLWATVIILFLAYKEPGIPLFNGLVFVCSSTMVICSILFHEKHAADHFIAH